MAFALTGIENASEFYSQHYLDEVLEQDLKELFTAWQAPGAESPAAKLRSMAGEYFRLRDRILKAKTLVDRVVLIHELAGKLFPALGYELQPETVEFEAGELPVVACYRGADGNPALVIALAPTDLDVPVDEWSTLGAAPLATGGADGSGITLFPDMDWETAASKIVFGDTHPPRWLLLLGYDEFLVIERSKWGRKALLRFDLPEIFGPRDDKLFRAVAALACKDSILPVAGAALLDTLDGNSHKHAYGVSSELKYAVREAIELIGNEAIRYKREVAKDKLYDRTDIDLAGELSRECITFMYRMLFLLYLEARPELGYAPVGAAAYLKGYSLEQLRDLEYLSLTTPEALDGTFIHESIQKLFGLIWEGFPPKAMALGGLELGSIHTNGFQLAPLQGHLFDPAKLKILNAVKLRNQVMQKVIRLMSLAEGKGRSHAGRISYAQLGINQLGSVYEALLSYRGFFAEEDLYEVKPAKKQKATGEEDEADDEEDEAPARRGSGDEVFDPLAPAWFVPAREAGHYTDAEKLFNGEPLIHKKGKFIFRLAGREREKSASYYTPEVLTQCLVKYALKELLQDTKRADDILKLTVCEPAMGSAAFLNEAINQLAEEYLQRKQKELGQTIPHSDYTREKQRVKMYIADTNVFGIDLNPVAVELAEVSLWLNAIFDGAHVPWFGMQLYTGNSLVGARRDVFPTALLSPGRGDKDKSERDWRYAVPVRVPATESPKETQVWHFLLPDIGMAGCTDKVVKALEPANMELVKIWRKAFNEPLRDDEVRRAKALTVQAEKLWHQHTLELARVRALTSDELHVWPDEQSNRAPTTTGEKDAVWQREMLSERVKNASPYRRLKLAMDYWCALWFWPVPEAEHLPTRDEWWYDLELLIHGNASLGGSAIASDLFPETHASSRVDFEVERDRYGHVNIDLLLQTNPRLNLAQLLAYKHRFLHWELEFSDIFKIRGGFDLLVGNPPWIKLIWEEQAFLADSDPRFMIRNLSAKDTADRRQATFNANAGVQANYIRECTAQESMQTYLHAIQNFPALKAVQTNLYKCFMATAWRAGATVQALLHPEGIYDDPKGGRLRKDTYSRLRAHFQFVNELFLFPEVGHQFKFSINIYGLPQSNPRFFHLSNLFDPCTVDSSFIHPGGGVIPTMKREMGGWETAGHKRRIIVVDSDQLSIFAKLYDSPGTAAMEARLPGIHSYEVMSVLEKLAAIPMRLGDSAEEYSATVCWDESGAQRSGTIERKTGFVASNTELVLSGPNIFIGNAFSKTPRRICSTKSDYDVLDLENLPDNYFPRTNYVRLCSASEFQRRLPRVSWRDPQSNQFRPISDYWRIGARRRANANNERSLRPIILPPGVTHIDAVFCIAMRTQALTVGIAGLWSSLPIDFLVRASGKQDFRDGTAKNLPIGGFRLELLIRTLTLNCITIAYAPIWRDTWRDTWRNDRWTSADRRLQQDTFQQLTSEWSRRSVLRSDFARRQALLEIDVIAAQAMSMTIEELLTIYRVQFPVLRQYDCDTWYDSRGRIAYTANKGFAGVGLPRKAGSKDMDCTIEYPDRRIAKKRLGWEDVQPKGGNPQVPDGTRIERPVMDDTMPGGPVERIIEYVAPFGLADREADYRVAWTEFERRAALEKAH